MSILRSLATSLILLCAFSCVACSLGEQGPLPADVKCELAADKYMNVAGTYQVKSAVDKKECGEGSEKNEFEATVEQNACNVTLRFAGVAFKGVLKDKTALLNGSYESLGTVTKEIKLNFTDKSFSGEEKWTYEGAGTKCIGTGTFTATKN